MKNLGKYLFSCSFFIMLPFSSYANCKLPDTLANKSIISRVSPLFTKENPLAGELMKLSFNKDGTYINNYLTNEKKYSGKYIYKKVTESVAFYSAEEEFENKITKYEVWLHCTNNVSGKYVYRQEDGAIAPQVRSNVGEYFFDR